jgi:hypothetical protein
VTLLKSGDGNMLTSKELEQLVTAVDCMAITQINDKDYISKHNVFVLLSKFTEDDPTSEVVK